MGGPARLWNQADWSVVEDPGTADEVTVQFFRYLQQYTMLKHLLLQVFRAS
jgi:hypothetical protein